VYVGRGIHPEHKKRLVRTMKNYILKIWVATPDCREMQMIEYSASDFKGVESLKGV
jgi:hypothetical protein